MLVVTWVPGTGLGAEDTAVNKIEFALKELQDQQAEVRHIHKFL